MSKLITAALLCAALGGVAVWTACSNATVTVKAAVKPEKDRKAAPEFALKDSNGQTVHLADYKGKVVLLDFWATWCAPCKIEIPWFIDFEQQYKDRGFAVLGVSMDIDDGWTIVKPFVQDLKINYRVLLGNEQIGDLYGGLDALPTTLLLDRQGKIANIYIGAKGKEEFRNDIVHLLDTPRAGSGSPSRALAILAGAK